MNTFFEMANHPIVIRLGWVLLHSLWQGALVGIVFGLCRIALRRRSSGVRYLAGCLALIAIVVMPAVTFFREPAHVSSDKPNAGAFQAGGESAVGGGGGLVRSDFGNGTETFVRWSAESLSRVAPWIVTIWLGGVLICSSRLIRSCWLVKTLRTRNNIPLDGSLMETLDDLRRRFGVSRPVRLFRSALVEVPTVVGWLRPVILMPAASLAGLTPQQLEAILAHELVHVRRLDHLVNVFQCLVETLMFYHPVVWWISRVVREEREHCCDDLVVKVCGNRMAYAQALVTLEAVRSGLPEFAFAASGGSLTNRIRRLFGMPTEGKTSGSTQLGGLALLGVGLLLTALGVYLMLTPKTYRAEASIKLGREMPVSEMNDGQNATDHYDPYLIETEVAVIQSQPVLGKVIAALDLGTEWGRKYGNGTTFHLDEMLGFLKSRMELRPVQSTSLIKIGVNGNDPVEAAKIANSIAEVYRDHRIEERRQLVLGGIKALEDRYQEMEAKVRQVQREADQLRKALDISDGYEGAAPSASFDSDALRDLEKRRIESETFKIRSERLLSQLKAISAEELREVLPTTVHDSNLSELLSQLNMAEQRFVTFQKGYGSNHPEYTRAKDLVDKINEQINRRVKGIMDGLETEGATYKAQVEHIEEALQNAKTIDQEKAQRSRPYYEKTRELESLTRFIQILSLKMESGKIDMSLPGRPSVIIVDKALPPRRASSPNRALAVALIAIGLLLDVAGLTIISAGRRTRPVPQS